jgi:hypothetical protein
VDRPRDHAGGGHHVVLGGGHSLPVFPRPAGDHVVDRAGDVERPPAGVVAGPPHVLTHHAQEAEVEPPDQEGQGADEPEAGPRGRRGGQHDADDGEERGDEAERGAEVARHPCRGLAELDARVDNQLDLLGVGPLAAPRRPRQLLEGHRGLVEPGPGHQAEDVAVGLLHGVDHVQDGAGHQDDRRTLRRVGRDSRPPVEPAAEAPGERVGQPRGHRPGRPYAPHDVVAGLPGGEKATDDLEGLLEVRRQGDRARSPGGPEASGDGGVRPEVAGQGDDPGVDGADLECRAQELRGPVDGAVVHDDELEPVAGVGDGDGAGELDQTGHVLGLVVGGDDQADQGASARYGGRARGGRVVGHGRHFRVFAPTGTVRRGPGSRGHAAGFGASCRGSLRTPRADQAAVPAASTSATVRISREASATPSAVPIPP